ELKKYLKKEYIEETKETFVIIYKRKIIGLTGLHSIKQYSARVGEKFIEGKFGSTVTFLKKNMRRKGFGKLTGLALIHWAFNARDFDAIQKDTYKCNKASNFNIKSM